MVPTLSPLEQICRVQDLCVERLQVFYFPQSVSTTKIQMTHMLMIVPAHWTQHRVACKVKKLT